MDTSRNILAWAQVVQAVNRSDWKALEPLLADDCVYTASGEISVPTREEIITVFKAIKEQGWTSHNTLSIVAQGPFLSTTYSNDFANAPSSDGAAVIVFGTDGKITHVRANEPPDVMARLSEGA